MTLVVVTIIIKNIKLYNYALSDINGKSELKLPLRSNSIFKDNIEELFKLGAATMHPENEIKHRCSNYLPKNTDCCYYLKSEK